MVDSKQNRLNVLFVHRNKYTLAEKELRKVCKSVEKRKEDSENRGYPIKSFDIFAVAGRAGCKHGFVSKAKPFFI